MKKMYRKGIAYLLALLLCGCAAEETGEKTEEIQPTATVAEATATPEGTSAEDQIGTAEENAENPTPSPEGIAHIMTIPTRLCATALNHRT